MALQLAESSRSLLRGCSCSAVLELRPKTPFYPDLGPKFVSVNAGFGANLDFSAASLGPGYQAEVGSGFCW